jgi:hypothetical protein
MTFTHDIFIEFLNALAEGVPDKEQGLRWLETALCSVEADIDSVARVVEKSEHYERSPEEIDLGLTALGDYREAVQSAWIYLADDWDEGLSYAAKKAEDGREKMILAQLRSRDARSRQVLDMAS